MDNIGGVEKYRNIQGFNWNKNEKLSEKLSKPKAFYETKK